MRNGKEFINRVVKKMGYNPTDFRIVDGNTYEDVNKGIEDDLYNGMVFLEGSCIPDSISNQMAVKYNESKAHKVITFGEDGGISIIVCGQYTTENEEGLNVQPLGVINSFLNELLNPVKEEVVEEFVKKGIVQPDFKEVMSTDSDIKIETKPTEHISLKDYYKLNLPDNKIGRKGDKTLIKELEAAGFKVD